MADWEVSLLDQAVCDLVADDPEWTRLPQDDSMLVAVAECEMLALTFSQRPAGQILIDQALGSRQPAWRIDILRGEGSPLSLVCPLLTVFVSRHRRHTSKRTQMDP